jgi:hypothetical protein
VSQSAAAQVREDSARRNPYSAQFYQDRPAPANDDDGPAPTFAELSHLDELGGTDDFTDVLPGGKPVAGRLSTEAVPTATLPDTPATSARGPSLSPPAGSVTCLQPRGAGGKRKGSTETKPRPRRKRRTTVPLPPVGSAAADRLAAAQKCLSLRVGHSEKQKLVDACVAFCKSRAGGQKHARRQTSPRSTATNIRIICSSSCGMCINLRQGQRSGNKWYVDFPTSNFEHCSDMCSSKPTLSGRPPQSLVAHVKELGPSMTAVSNKAIDDMLIRAGYHVPTVSNSSWVGKRKRLKQLAFQTNAAGIQNHLSTCMGSGEVCSTPSLLRLLARH